MAPLNILIVGCGIAGSTLASFLLLADLPAAQKPHITILERSPDLRAQGQNIDIRGAGIAIMRKLGLETMIRKSTTGEEGVQFVDENNTIWAAFPADKSGQVSTPTADIEILRGRLAEICYLRSKQVSDEEQKNGGAGIEYIFGDQIKELEQDGRQVHVHLAKSETKRTFDVVVAADGLQSRTRSMVWGAAGEAERVKRLGMYGAFFSIPKGESDSQWRRWFHASGRRGIMLRPDGQGKRTTVFMYVINEQDTRLPQTAIKGPEAVEEQKRLFQGYFQDAGWECDRILREMMSTKDFYCDMVGQVKMDHWSKGRIVLLGDAGYCASPISGMGTTLALSGAYNLAGAITHHPNDHTAAFEEYETKMRPVVDQAQRLVPGAPHILSPETAWGVSIMNWIVFLLDRSGLIHTLFKFIGPGAKTVTIEEYGFRDAPELTEPDTKIVR